jgi:hypothetical protein
MTQFPNRRGERWFIAMLCLIILTFPLFPLSVFAGYLQGALVWKNVFPPWIKWWSLSRMAVESSDDPYCTVRTLGWFRSFTTLIRISFLFLSPLGALAYGVWILSADGTKTGWEAQAAAVGLTFLSAAVGVMLGLLLSKVWGVSLRIQVLRQQFDVLLEVTEHTGMRDMNFRQDWESARKARMNLTRRNAFDSYCKTLLNGVITVLSGKTYASELRN